MLLILLLTGSLYDTNFMVKTMEGNIRPIQFRSRKKINLLPTLSGNDRSVGFGVPNEVVHNSFYKSSRRNVVDSANIPYYVNSLNEIEAALKNLNDNLLSMAGAIPSLLDPRRDIAEIISVVYGIAKRVADTCILVDYELSYEKLINEFSPMGLSEPEEIITELQEGIDKFNSVTGSLTTLIRNKCPNRSNARLCDHLIHQIVISQPQMFEKASKVLFMAYNAAYAYNQVSNEFTAAANSHQAHKLIIESPWKLKGLIYAVANLYYSMSPSLSVC